MIGRADIEGSKSNVAMNAWLPRAIIGENSSTPFAKTVKQSVRLKTPPLPQVETEAASPVRPPARNGIEAADLPRPVLSYRRRAIQDTIDSRTC
ncbi:hypothetical protein JTE90_005937 [Oedothorax gibbosus]|uniref:Uncharacterized protein n=1 Tax=Oedothorax gibbosus TaxID=931172 RepID=A0AAV6TFJ5_9ARAC|nr:hypothetical protein JTE90_005937 [Oedothorax gibbosus]